jgi:hypothetical protein
MVFEAVTARLTKVIRESDNLETFTQLSDIPKYQSILEAAFLHTNPLVFGVVHIRILEELMNDVEHEGVVNEHLYQAMDLILKAIATLDLGILLEERRDNIAHHFSRIKNDRSLR